MNAQTDRIPPSKALPAACGSFFLSLGLHASLPAADLPQFHVPGFEEDMSALNELHALHHERAFTPCTLWDAWLPMATLWASETKSAQYRAALLSRRIDSEGYVSMQQHRGMAHSEGWPFPAWQQSTGAGFHFSTAGEVWAIQNFGLKPLATTNGWDIGGAAIRGIDPVAGLQLKATADIVTLTTPPFRCGTIVAPFARLEWAARGLTAESTARLEWLLEGESDWPEQRAATVAAPVSAMQYANVPMYRQAGYAGLLTRYRICIDHAAGAEIDLKSIITAIDTRHPTTNALFIQACCEYVAWTRDLDFLRQNIGRMRQAQEFALREFRVREENHVFVPWVGHDGRSGLAFGAGGKKTARPGLGVGNNYWDLLPFGAHDAAATLALYQALRSFAALESAIANHPEWQIPPIARPDAHGPGQLAQAIRQDFQTRFWNPDTGRFHGWIDIGGHAYDYGFTFLNLEAVYSGIANEGQAASIFAWLDGRREVAADTSRGTDIYHWRFGPRATTRRNVETYVWPWFYPERIPWGDQVQDGGAVLGFSYYDLMARLQARGPDDAWKRLREILAWFREVQAEGGYRAYYSQPGRGSLQGGGKAGGLGLDQEFFESVLVPQVMLRGFLGFHASAEGYTVHPRLPHDWPSLTIAGIRVHGQVLDVIAHRDGRIETRPRPASPAGRQP